MHTAVRRHVESGYTPGLVTLVQHRGRHVDVGILMTQRRPDMLDIPALTLDFWTSVYQLIDD